MSQRDTAATDTPSDTLSVAALTAMVVGSMVGAGVFTLPQRFASQTGVLGAVIAWVVAGAGMLMLGFVFQSLAVRKPQLDNGVYVYAKTGFGVYPGFLSAFGYWASSCAGNTFYWVLITSTLKPLVPAFGDGDTLLAVAVSSAGIWGFYLLIMRGVKEAAGINAVVTAAKMIPLLVFVVVAIVALKPDVFVENITGGYDEVGGDSLFDQVQGTMLVTVFVFLGIEGASVYSRYARKREDVGRATVLGFLSVLALFGTVSIISYGILPKAELATLRQPSVGSVLEAAVGPWGAWFISAGLIVSVLGAFLAWSLMAAEVLFAAAKDRDLPAFLAKSTAKGVPSNALLLSTLFIQLLLVVVLFASGALDFMLDLTAALSLIPFALAAGYALKIAVTRDGYAGLPGRIRTRELVVAAIAVVYTLFLIWAAGPVFLLFACILLAPGTLLYAFARREQNGRVFTTPGWIVFALVVVGALAGLVGLATGAISI
ncbi:arginine:ornithine antiporter/lysine permease [Conyzicola lurida]|uniref:Arginine:ornithine antiporter/lysine permease n=1 Tax=Conyzicola lurida TaxID=1172621 RepID=A0A841AL48_9MICO|nr:basic amino acid/polyamine antiporter [Conyzicola lurida]MBB5843957.1 arginine:ornithine antiporter/lysine permease [Conyzicola lurida]